MSVMQRKLFANKEARTKLRDMGGIMSSFPELSGEVQRFQDGGPITYGQWQAMSRSERANAGLPVSLLGGQLHFNRFGVGLGMNDPETGERLMEPPAAADSAVRRPPTGPTAAPGPIRVEQVAAALGLTVPEFAQAAEDMGMTVLEFAQYVSETRGEAAPPNRWEDFDFGPARPETPPRPLSPSPIDYLSASPLFGAPMTRETPEGGIERISYRENLERQMQEKRDSMAAPAPEEEPAPAEEEPGMTTGTPIYEQRIADLLPTTEETPEVTTDETGNGDTPDIRARAEERIKLFQDLFGSDEPTARDRAMQFAMIGLAIAAGQSPNALTNIASGLLAGTQAMTAQEAERRKEARKVKSDAVTSVLDELEAERKAARGDGGFQDRESLDDAVTALAKTLASSENYKYEDPDVPFRIAWDLMTRMPGYAPYRALPNPYAPAPPSGGTGAAVPTDAPGPAFPDDMTEEEKEKFGG